jgi:Na+-driven multidrug efflux pump
LSKSISRFISFELGKGNREKLQKIFSTSINIQLSIGFLILLLGETIGVWFLNTQMNIPANRMIAANWVLQCAMFSFFVGLTQVPYTACIIGHEKMSVFAWFSIVSSVFRLLIVYMLYISPYDKLISLSVLGFIVSLSIRIAQRIYCVRTFPECHYKFTFEKPLVKEMTGFAGWSFLTNTAWIFNNQGVNILINIFFGVSFNAARGIVNSMEGVIKKFYHDFTTAMNPQIIKSYAAGELEEMNKLICRGTRLSFYLMLVLSLPFVFEAHTVLFLWLGMVPDYTEMFFRLSLIASLINMFGQTGYTACMATGRIKWYTIIMTSVGFLVFPLTWISYKLGAPVEISYIIFIIIYTILDIIRLFLMKHLWGFPIMMFIKEVVFPVIKISVLSIIIPCAIKLLCYDGIFYSFIIMLMSLISSLLIIWLFGLKEDEKLAISNVIKTKLRINRIR